MLTHEAHGRTISSKAWSTPVWGRTTSPLTTSSWRNSTSSWWGGRLANAVPATRAAGYCAGLMTLVRYYPWAAMHGVVLLPAQAVRGRVDLLRIYQGARVAAFSSRWLSLWTDRATFTTMMPSTTTMARRWHPVASGRRRKKPSSLYRPTTFATTTPTCRGSADAVWGVFGAMLPT